MTHGDSSKVSSLLFVHLQTKSCQTGHSTICIHSSILRTIRAELSTSSLSLTRYLGLNCLLFLWNAPRLSWGFHHTLIQKSLKISIQLKADFSLLGPMDKHLERSYERLFHYDCGGKITICTKMEGFVSSPKEEWELMELTELPRWIN